MAHALAFLKAAVVSAGLVLTVFMQGCSVGFTNLHPGENDGAYASLFDDVITLYDEPYWLWVRGSISGDLSGTGLADEEVVLATIQKGNTREPGPIEVAFLVACRVEPDGKRTAIARSLLFDANPVPGAPRPINDLGIFDAERPLTHCRAQMIQDKVSPRESVVVYFWGDSRPSNVWYAGFALTGDGWKKNLESVMWQAAPGFLTANLDRSPEATPFGYQLLFGVAAIPERVSAQIGPPRDAPLWGHVFARNADGYYEQADARFIENYRHLSGAWNQTYLKAVIHGLPPEDLAWYEYHLGILNHYLGNQEMAAGFLRKARRYAVDPRLRRGLDEAMGNLGVAAPAAGAKAGGPGE